MKNVLYISQLYHDSLFGEYFKCSKVALDYAANNLSRAILKGFRENNAPVEVLNAPVIGSFPLYYKKPFVKGIKINGFESISYCNLMYIKRSDIHRKMNKRILEWCAKSKDNRILFFYSYTHLPVIEKVKKYFPDSKVFLLAADLPEYMASDNGFITRLNNCMGGNKPASGSFFDHVDGYVLLSAAMKDRLPVGEKPWIVIEGIYDPEQDDEDVEKDKNKVVLYTGNLGRRYGIVDLLEAFHGIDNPDYRLWICGNGDGLFGFCAILLFVFLFSKYVYTLIKVRSNYAPSAIFAFVTILMNSFFSHVFFYEWYLLLISLFWGHINWATSEEMRAGC